MSDTNWTIKSIIHKTARKINQAIIRKKIPAIIYSHISKTYSGAVLDKHTVGNFLEFIYHFKYSHVLHFLSRLSNVYLGNSMSTLFNLCSFLRPFNRIWSQCHVNKGHHNAQGKGLSCFRVKIQKFVWMFHPRIWLLMFLTLIASDYSFTSSRGSTEPS